MKISDIPYLKHFPNDGRIVPISHFFDGQSWHLYLAQPDNTVIDLKPVVMVSGFYVAAAPAAASDIELPLLTFLFQHYPTAHKFSQFEFLHSDLENSLAVLHKQFILFKYFTATDDHNQSKIIATEMEYGLLNHRSAYDLLHGLILAFLKDLKLTKNQIRDSFATFAEKEHEARIKAFKLPVPLSDFIEARRSKFLLFRDLRDLVAHHGHTVDWIFKTPSGFGLGANSKIAEKLRNAGLWSALKPGPNDLASCFALLALLAEDLFKAADALPLALSSSVTELPPQTAPGYRIFMRSTLLEHYHLLPNYLDNPWRFVESPNPSSATPATTPPAS